MPIEVTSVPERGWSFSLGRFRFRDLSTQLSTKAIVLRLVITVTVLTMVVAGDALIKSYKHHARIVDARLASGYLTSRPGIYAAPRVLRAGQGFSAHELEQVLRRAGYVQSETRQIWNGSFRRTDNIIEISPGASRTSNSARKIRIVLDEQGIQEITGDDSTLESFTLEPEILTNDYAGRTLRDRKLTYDEIPPVLVKAIIAIEDQRFFAHTGIDLLGLARALKRNAGDERVGQGGSTITQQLIKNTYLTPERTLQRKYAEAMLALALERRLSKEDIFALYCNEIYLGHRGSVGARGVEQAAQLFFGKSLKSLSLAEAATLAGLIQSPTRYSPERNPEAARNRRDQVLDAMVRENFITAEEYAAAKAGPVEVSQPDRASKSLAPHFLDYVVRTAAEDLDVENAQRRIYTTIDLELQRAAEIALDQQLQKLDSRFAKQNVKPQASLVALDPRTGHVLAMVGGRNYAESQLNRATDARRQPGSTFKPFVYAAALESGMSPVRQFSDSPREFVYDRTRVYRPANYGGGYSMRDVTMREGLIKSLNVVTVDIALQTGLARIANLAERFGLPRPERYPALALGTSEVTPLELAAAYASFANGGKRIEPRVITSVSAAPGAHTVPVGGAQVIEPATAYMITNMLSAATNRGTGRAARDAANGSAIAGKTGTSRDSWFVGYTPNLVCVVWIGFDDNSQLGLSGATAALPAWTEFMNAAVRLRPELGGRTFECPEGIKFVEIDTFSGALSTVSCPYRELIAVTEQTRPNIECYQHGHLPEVFPETEQTAQVMTPTVVVREQHAQRENWTPYLNTGVSVDANGRRTLVNDLR